MEKLGEKHKLEKSDYREWERKLSRERQYKVNSKLLKQWTFVWLVEIQIWALQLSNLELENVSIANWVQLKPMLLFLIEENYTNI